MLLLRVGKVVNSCISGHETSLLPTWPNWTGSAVNTAGKSLWNLLGVKVDVSIVKTWGKILNAFSGVGMASFPSKQATSYSSYGCTERERERERERETHLLFFFKYIKDKVIRSPKALCTWLEDDFENRRDSAGTSLCSSLAGDNNGNYVSTTPTTRLDIVDHKVSENYPALVTHKLESNLLADATVKCYRTCPHYSRRSRWFFPLVTNNNPTRTFGRCLFHCSCHDRQWFPNEMLPHGDLGPADQESRLPVSPVSLNTYPHTHAHTHTHARTHPKTHSHTHTLTYTHTHTLTHSHTLTHTPSHTPFAMQWRQQLERVFFTFFPTTDLKILTQRCTYAQWSHFFRWGARKVGNLLHSSETLLHLRVTKFPSLFYEVSKETWRILSHPLYRMEAVIDTPFSSQQTINRKFQLNKVIYWIVSSAVLFESAGPWHLPGNNKSFEK